MKVLQIIDILDVGGAERVFVNMCNLLHNHKVNVSTLVFGRVGKLESELLENIPKVPFKRSNKWNLKEWYTLSKIFRQYDILHVHMRHNFVYVKLIAKLFRVKTKIILHDHSSEFKDVSSSLKLFLRPMYFIGVSNKLVQWSKNTLKVKDHHAFLLYNTVVRKEVGKVGRKEGIVVVGNIKPGKNQLFVIELLPLLQMNVTFIGRIQDKPYFLELKERISALNLKDRVTFLTDIDNVQEQLPKFKLALMPSVKESGPLVLVEYLAQELPFVSYKTGEISEVLSETFPSLFLTNFQKDQWLEKISLVSKDEHSGLRALYEKSFSPSKYIQLCTKIYQEVLSS